MFGKGFNYDFVLTPFGKADRKCYGRRKCIFKVNHWNSDQVKKVRRPELHRDCPAQLFFRLDEPKQILKRVALSSVHQPKTPAYASKQKSKKVSQASIFLRTILHINIIRIEPIVICTENLPKRFVHEGFGKC